MFLPGLPAISSRLRAKAELVVGESACCARRRCERQSGATLGGRRQLHRGLRSNMRSNARRSREAVIEHLRSVADARGMEAMHDDWVVMTTREKKSLPITRAYTTVLPSLQ